MWCPGEDETRICACRALYVRGVGINREPTGKRSMSRGRDREVGGANQLDLLGIATTLALSSGSNIYLAHDHNYTMNSRSNIGVKPINSTAQVMVIIIQ